MDDMISIENKVFDFIRKNTLADSQKITIQTLIFREGIFDSMAFVLLIDFIESTFNFKLSDKDLIEENFESIEAITRYIHQKQSTTT